LGRKGNNISNVQNISVNNTFFGIILGENNIINI
jgi:hypothetical protein